MSTKPRPGSRRSSTKNTPTCSPIYDENGGYGHPDHIQVHVVGVRAAELAGTKRVYEATINRDHIRRMMAQMPRDPDAAGIAGRRR